MIKTIRNWISLAREVEHMKQVIELHRIAGHVEGELLDRMAKRLDDLERRVAVLDDPTGRSPCPK